jgi:hypothetical protein
MLRELRLNDKPDIQKGRWLSMKKFKISANLAIETIESPQKVGNCEEANVFSSLEITSLKGPISHVRRLVR